MLRLRSSDSLFIGLLKLLVQLVIGIVLIFIYFPFLYYSKSTHFIHFKQNPNNHINSKPKLIKSNNLIFFENSNKCSCGKESHVENISDCFLESYSTLLKTFEKYGVFHI